MRTSSLWLRFRPTLLCVWLGWTGGMLGCGSASVPGPRFSSSAISEPSGLAASRQFVGVYWTHNDSGDSNRIFAVAANGDLIAQYFISNAKAIDWEAIAIDDAGFLYVGDIGNNDNERRDLTVYRVKEPDPTAVSDKLAVDRTVRFAYPDQKRFPDPDQRNFDAEALFWAPRASDGKGTLFLLTKHRSDLRTVLYRFDDLSGSAPITLTRVGEYEVGGGSGRFGGMVTGADATLDGRHLAVLSYHAVFIFERPNGSDNYLSRPINRIDLEQDVTVQAEAIAWDGSELLFTNEQRRIFRIPTPLSPQPGRFPSHR